MIRFRERMVGWVGPVPRTARTIPPRGPHGADGIVRLAATTVGSRPAVLDLRDLHVVVDGIDTEADGFRARITRGTVIGVATTPLEVVCGFADILTRSRGGRRMHYRLLVEDRAGRYVIDGVKAVRGGTRTAWSGTTTLHTIVVRVDPATEAGGDPGGWLATGRFDGEVESAGVLRVRGLVRQGLSLRGAVVPFLVGFVRRAVSV